jgi:hypothetical protein
MGIILYNNVAVYISDCFYIHIILYDPHNCPMWYIGWVLFISGNFREQRLCLILLICV